MGSYRTQAVFSDQSLADAAQAYDRWKTFLGAARHALGVQTPDRLERPRRPLGGAAPEGPGGDYIGRFLDAMDDDFNSAEAFAAVHDLVREGNRRIEGVQRGEEDDARELRSLLDAFLEVAEVLNFHFTSDIESSGLVEGLVAFLVDLRQQARDEKAFQRADAIRARLAELGVLLEDTPAGTRWRVATGERRP